MIHSKRIKHKMFKMVKGKVEIIPSPFSLSRNITDETVESDMSRLWRSRPRPRVPINRKGFK